MRILCEKAFLTFSFMCNTSLHNITYFSYQLLSESIKCNGPHSHFILSRIFIILKVEREFKKNSIFLINQTLGYKYMDLTSAKTSALHNFCQFSVMKDTTTNLMELMSG